MAVLGEQHEVLAARNKAQRGPNKNDQSYVKRRLITRRSYFSILLMANRQKTKEANLF